MKRRILPLLSIAAALACAAVFAFASGKTLFLKAEENLYTLTLSSANGAVTSESYCESGTLVTARTNLNNPITVSYTGACQSVGALAELRATDSSGNNAGSLQILTPLTGLKSVTVNWHRKGGVGSYGPRVCFAESPTFNDTASETQNTFWYQISNSTASDHGSYSTPATRNAPEGCAYFQIRAIGGSDTSLTNTTVILDSLVFEYSCPQIDPSAITLDTALNATTKPSESTRTILDGTPYFHGGFVSGAGLGTLYGRGYLYNQYPIAGMSSFTANFSGTGSLRLSVGYAAGNFDKASYELTSGETITFEGTKPNFFYLENTSGNQILVDTDTSGTKSITTTLKDTYYSSSDRPIYTIDYAFDSSKAVAISSIVIHHSGADEALTAGVRNQKYIQITASGLNVRRGPGTGYATVARGSVSSPECLAYRETVQAEDESLWYRTYYMGCDAYISANPSYSNLVTSASLGNNAVESVVAESQKYVGCVYLLGAPRYAWSATGSKDASFNPCYYDCSSFTMRAYRDGAGIYIGASTSAQIDYGTKVASTANLIKGDLPMLVSYSSQDTSVRTNVGHVVLYLDATSDPILIQASGGDFTGSVRMKANWNSYWKSHFIEGRRAVE